ncbi:MAG: NAD(P)/FAD-dependent oxidoreductase [Actinomycetota bacterium]|nr:NAD(P)/FAD-dependent oxidoreductase [Actinomycetota bacterium]
MTSEGPPTVVVVGGGFAGLSTAKRLKRTPVRTILIDQNNYHLFAPLLYQVATSLLEPAEIATPIRAILRRVRNAEFLMARVLSIDFDRNQVITDRGEVAFDYLVLAAGSKTNYFGNAALEKATVAMKNLNDALDLRNRVLSLAEEAKWARDAEARRKLLSFVVVGGGSTGVETAGALQELIHHVLRKDFKEMSLADASVTLLEASDRLLPPFHPRLQQGAARQLRKKGVEVRLNTSLTEVRAGEALLSDGSIIPAGLVVWAAGVAATDLGDVVSDDLGKGRTVRVEPTLQLPGHPNVFAIGDLAAVEWQEQQLPMLAPVALQGGKHAARNIKHLVKGEPPEEFRYLDKGIMSTIGRNSAVMQFRGLRSEGYFAWLSWLFVHLLLIVSGRSQLSILMNWFWNYVKNDRAARLILKPTEAMATARTTTESDVQRGDHQHPADVVVPETERSTPRRAG